MNVGDRVSTQCRFVGNKWVGKSRPVLKNTFESVDGEILVVYSTSYKLKELLLNQVMMVSGVIKQQNENGSVLDFWRVEPVNDL